MSDRCPQCFKRREHGVCINCDDCHDGDAWADDYQAARPNRPDPTSEAPTGTWIEDRIDPPVTAALRRMIWDAEMRDLR